jgi:protein gp37
MATKSIIEWTESTWNPITGCSKISPGCDFCYAERLAKRLNRIGVKRYSNSFNLTLHPDILSLPLQWKSPKVIFVNSMSDLFHENVPFEFIQQVFETMKQASWHTFQILTKRSKRLVKLAPLLEWPDNVWMGVSVESEKYQFRIDDLRKIPSAVRFLSIEPLIAPTSNLDLKTIDWVIVGGESGPGARPMNEEWVTQIKEECDKFKTPFFFKQWGGVRKKLFGRVLLGNTWDAMPTPKNPKIRKAILLRNTALPLLK